jgi:hypothetical protein
MPPTQILRLSTATPLYPQTYVRSFTAANSGVGVAAGDGAKLYLTDTVNISGVSCGLSLSGSALVTDMKKNGGWLTFYSTEARP